MGVLFFIILLGMIVHLMNMSGANKEVRKMGKQKIKNEKQSLTGYNGVGHYYLC